MLNSARTSFVTRPDIQAPILKEVYLNKTAGASRHGKDLFFLSEHQPGRAKRLSAAAYDENLELVWWDEQDVEGGHRPFGTWHFHPMTLNGEPVVGYLTLQEDAQGKTTPFWGLYNSKLHKVASGRGIENDGDIHEFSLTHNNTLLFTSYEVKDIWTPDIRKSSRVKTMYNCCFEERDLNGTSLFKWCQDKAGIDVKLSVDRYKVWKGHRDPFHINSVVKDMFGNYLISSRQMSVLYYISGQTKEILWELGGKKSSFRGTGADIFFQHHANWLPATVYDTTGQGKRYLSLFDNRNVTEASHGKVIELNFDSMTATTLHSFFTPKRHDKYARAEGSMQVLLDANGHSPVGYLVGYGYEQHFTEFSVDGVPRRTIRWGGREDAIAYRVHKAPWYAMPERSPDYVAKNETLFVSWNGATEVATWQLWKGDGNIKVAETKRTGFETTLKVKDSTLITSEDLRLVATDDQANIVWSSFINQKGIDSDTGVNVGSNRHTLLVFAAIIFSLFFSIFLLAIACHKRQNRLRRSYHYDALKDEDLDIPKSTIIVS